MDAGHPSRDARFFAVSLNDNAPLRSSPVWTGRFSADAVENLHLDLRKFAPRGTVMSGEELRAAREAAFPFLRQKQLTGNPSPTEVFLRCKFSFALWLGYEMRFTNIQVAYNLFESLTPFPHSGRITTLGTGEYHRFELEPPMRPVSGASRSDAVLIIDMIGKATDHQLELFFPSPGAPPISTREAYRFTRTAPGPISSDDIGPSLKDILELFAQLRRRGVQCLHLGFIGPDVLAFYLGQLLNAAGMAIHLYEFGNEPQPGYHFAFPLESLPADQPQVTSPAAPAAPQPAAAPAHFLDDNPLRFDRPETHRVLTLVQTSITDTGEIRQLLRRADVKVGHIKTDGAAAALWEDAFETAHRQKRLEALLETIVGDSYHRRLAEELEPLVRRRA